MWEGRFLALCKWMLIITQTMNRRFGITRRIKHSGSWSRLSDVTLLATCKECNIAEFSFSLLLFSVWLLFFRLFLISYSLFQGDLGPLIMFSCTITVIICYLAASDWEARRPHWPELSQTYSDETYYDNYSRIFYVEIEHKIHLSWNQIKCEDHNCAQWVRRWAAFNRVA